MPVSHVPDGFRAVTPFLTVAGAPALIRFLKDAFDAEVLDDHRERDGTVRHAALRVFDSMVEVSEAQSEWPPMPAALHLYVRDADAIFARAVAAGADVLFEPMDMPYGERSGGVKDCCGNHWYVATRTAPYDASTTGRGDS